MSSGSAERGGSGDVIGGQMALTEGPDGVRVVTLAVERRSAGLPVGPLDQPGPALPDDWR